MVDQEKGFGRRGRTEPGREERRDIGGDGDEVNWGRVSLVFLGFAILFLFTSWYMGRSVDERTTTIRANQEYGPIKVTKPNTVYEIAVKSSLQKESWAFLEVEVLDAKKQYLFSFSKDLHHETGYDDGYWQETVNSVDMKLTVPDPGMYYLRFKVEGAAKNKAKANNLASSTKLRLTITRRFGSSLLHMWVGIIVLIIAIVLNELHNRTITRLVKTAASKADD